MYLGLLFAYSSSIFVLLAIHSCLLIKIYLKILLFKREKYKQLLAIMCKKAYLLDEMPNLRSGN